MFALPKFARTATIRSRFPDIAAALAGRLQAPAAMLARHSLALLRISLGLVFIWFGALKFSDATPVGALVAATIPFMPVDVLLPALGGFEVLIGVALLVGRQLPAVALLMVAHLAGTFLVLVTQPQIAFQHGNVLYPTMTGEFVIKNVVLISAGLVLATLAPSGNSLVPVPDAIPANPLD